MVSKMKAMIKKGLLMLSSLIFFALSQSCETDSFELDLKYKGDKIVIGGYISVDSLHLTISRSANLVDSFRINDLKLINPKVVIRERDGAFSQQLSSQDGFRFIAKNIGLQVGKAYQIQVTADKLAPAETDWILIPELVTIDSFKTEPYRRNEVIGHVLDFNLKDPLGENFYFIDFKATLRGAKSRNSTQGWPFDEQINGNCYNAGLFDDMCFDGKNPTFKYVVKTSQVFQRRGNEEEQGDQLIIRFGSVSKQLHLARSQGSGDDIIEGLNEPPPTYTNVKNGYGLVFAFNAKDYVINLK
jgi:Domain of unknown function (DUF4249)